eukprot:scaffold221_cov223-Prasinococcus_capsulatus_cf.AAC.2
MVAAPASVTAASLATPPMLAHTRTGRSKPKATSAPWQPPQQQQQRRQQQATTSTTTTTTTSTTSTATTTSSSPPSATSAPGGWWRLRRGARRHLGAVPAEVAQRAEPVGVALDADVVPQKVLAAVEAEARRDLPHVADLALRHDMHAGAGMMMMAACCCQRRAHAAPRNASTSVPFGWGAHLRQRVGEAARAVVVHEHGAVHEEHAGGAACGEHGARLLA